MKTALTFVFALVACGALAAGLRAEEKQVTLKGTIMCSKCVLKETAKCGNAIQVKDGDKTVTYYFIDQGAKEEYHEEVCGGDKKEGTVTGVLSTKDGKNYIKPSKVEYAKK